MFVGSEVQTVDFSENLESRNFTRYFQGTRIIKSDVDAMIEFQQKWDPVVPGVHFVIGFSGKFFQRGNSKENEGDQYILGIGFY